jgi:APA family basic amino acid/polyamine antiporter
MTIGAGTASAEHAEQGLQRRLGLGSATALVIGEVIGVGIFLTPAGMARALASPALLLITWVTMGCVALAGALCFGALTARSPEAGGLYVFIRRAYGPGAGFLYGWLSLLVTDPGVTAALASGLAIYAGSLVPLPPLGLKAVAILAVFALAACNMIGLGLGAGLLRGLALMKVVLLAALVLWGFGMGLGDWSNLVPLVARRTGTPPLFGALAGGMIAAFFSFGGWWDLSKLAGEVRDPGRTVPRALVLGVVTVTTVYVLVSTVFLYLVPLSQVDSEQGFAARVGQVLFGRAGEKIFVGIVIVTVLGSLAAILMAAPRVYYAMARDGQFPPILAGVHPQLGTPVWAIGVQAILASVLIASGGFDQILTYFILPTLGFLALTVAAVYLPDREVDGVSPGPVPGYPITPMVFLVPTVLLMILLAAKDPARAALGVGVVAAGVPVYFLISRDRRAKKSDVKRLVPD